MVIFWPPKMGTKSGPIFFQFLTFWLRFFGFCGQVSGVQHLVFFSDLSEASLKYSIEALTSDTNWTTMIWYLCLHVFVTSMGLCKF